MAGQAEHLVHPVEGPGASAVSHVSPSAWMHAGMHRYLLFMAPLILGNVSLETESGHLLEASTKSQVIFTEAEDSSIQLESAQHGNS